MSVLHELYAIKIRDHRLDAKIILSVTKCVQKCLRNRTTNKKIQILRKNELNLRLLAKKSTKDALSGRFADPYRRGGDRCPIRRVDICVEP